MVVSVFVPVSVFVFVCDTHKHRGDRQQQRPLPMLPMLKRFRMRTMRSLLRSSRRLLRRAELQLQLKIENWISDYAEEIAAES